MIERETEALCLFDEDIAYIEWQEEQGCSQAMRNDHPEFLEDLE